MQDYCLDTHALIWYFTAHKSLSRRAKTIIKQGFIGKNSLVIPTLALLEIYHKNLKLTLLDFSTCLQSLQQSNIHIVSFDETILNTCYHLPKEINIHDRIIAATALAYNCPLITKDRTLAHQPKLKVIW